MLFLDKYRVFTHNQSTVLDKHQKPLFDNEDTNRAINTLNLLSPYAVTRLFTSEVFLLLTHCLHRSGSYITFPVPDKLPDFCGGCPDLLTVGPIEFSKRAIGRLQACLDVSFQKEHVLSS